MTAAAAFPSARSVRLLTGAPVFEAERAKIVSSLDALIEETLEIAAIPAPTFQEGRRAEWVADRLRAAGITDVVIDQEANVVGSMRGEEPGLLIAAHTDTVFSLENHRPPIQVGQRLVGPGVGDNSVAVVALIELARRLLALGPRRAVWLAATTGEEGLGDLKGVRSVVDRLAGRIAAVVAIEGHFLGRVVTTAVGSRRWRVVFRGAGGHSWHDYGKPSAVAVAADFVSRAGHLRLPRRPRTTINPGRIGGGEGVNVIAREAWVELDLRSEAESALAEAAAAVDALAQETAASSGTSVELTLIGDRPAGRLERSHPLAASAAAALRLVGEEPEFAAASTDANYPISKGVPSVCIGITRGGGMHMPDEWIDAEQIGRGLTQALSLTAALAEVRG